MYEQAATKIPDALIAGDEAVADAVAVTTTSEMGEAAKLGGSLHSMVDDLKLAAVRCKPK